MVKIKSVFFLTLFLLSLVSFEKAHSNNWIIEGDKVYIDDSRVYLSVTPHTLADSGKITLELISKIYDGEIDMVFGFHDNRIKIKNPMIWGNITETKTRVVETNKTFVGIIYNVTSFTDLGIENYDSYNVSGGNRWNKYLYNITGKVEGIKEETNIIAFSDFKPKPLNLSRVIIIGNETRGTEEEYEETYEGWKPFNYQNYEKDHCGTYGVEWFHILRKVNIQKNKHYKLQLDIEFPFIPYGETFSGKYVWGLKPSNLSVLQATNQNKLYLLDPWLDQNYQMILNFEIDNSDSSEHLIDFAEFFNLTRAWEEGYFNFTSMLLETGKNVKFTFDNTTEAPFEVEWFNKSQNIGYYWIGVSNETALDSAIKGSMYYNVSGTVDNENSTGVWDSYYKFVWHCNETSLTPSKLEDSTSNNIDGILGGATLQIASSRIGYGLKCTPSTPTTGSYSLSSAHCNDNQSYTLQAHFKSTGSPWNFHILMNAWGRQSNDPRQTYGSFPYFGQKDWSGSDKKAWSWTNNGIMHASYDHSTEKIYTQINGGTYGGVTCVGWDRKNQGSQQFASQGFYRSNGVFDEYRLSVGIKRSDDWIEADYQSLTDSRITFTSWGLYVPTLYIHVYDEDNIDIENAVVTVIEEADDEILLSELTDVTGYVSRDGVDSGNYTIIVNQQGYQTDIGILDYTGVDYTYNVTLIGVPSSFPTEIATINTNEYLLLAFNLFLLGVGVIGLFIPVVSIIGLFMWTFNILPDFTLTGLSYLSIMTILVLITFTVMGIARRWID